MGILISGPNGPIIGKVGKVIGSSRNGKHYIKGPYKKRTGTVSEKELLNRKKFALAQSWLAPLKDFVREGFRGYSQQSQGFIAAKSWLLKNALISDANGLRVDPVLMKVSSGDLPNPANIAVIPTETGDLKFTWGASTDGSHDADQIMMLVYNIESGGAYYKTTGQFRSVGEDTLPMFGLTGNFHVYAAFNAFDRSRQSDSVYLGEIKL